MRAYGANSFSSAWTAAKLFPYCFHKLVNALRREGTDAVRWGHLPHSHGRSALPDNRNKSKAWQLPGVKAAVGHTSAIADYGYRGTGLITPHRHEAGQRNFRYGKRSTTAYTAKSVPASSTPSPV